MITVTPIQEKEEQTRLCALCGIPFRTEALAYHAEEDGRFAGVCQFRLDDKGGHLLDLAAPLDAPNNEALFVMGRAALNFIDLCGVHFATFEGVGEDPLLRRIGFKQDEQGAYVIDLTGFFAHPCEHAAH